MQATLVAKFNTLMDRITGILKLFTPCMQCKRIQLVQYQEIFRTTGICLYTSRDGKIIFTGIMKKIKMYTAEMHCFLTMESCL